ncbi:MAG TPA: c-type cytochrome [Sphingobium sp.]|nr:c-type cytochrome [Sphingobium sp.]
MRIARWLGGAAVVGGLSWIIWGQIAGGTPLSSEPNRPWPAVVDQSVPESQPALAPADALKTFTMPPGYRLELVAAEPLVKDPILAEFDGDGRLWVLEMRGFAINEKMENSLEPINELVILEDTDGDGVYDKRTVFMDKLVLPRAFKVLAGNCALIGEPPHLWKACDTNGDLKADTKELVADGFATQGVVEHGANGLVWAMDNSIVVAQNGWNLRFRNGRFETVPSLSRGQWGVTQDDSGRVYRNINTDPLFVDYIAPRYYVRNPDMIRTRGLYDPLVKQEETMIWPARPTFGVNRGYRSEVYREDGSATYYAGVSSPMIYRGTQLPADVRGQPFVVDSPTNIVHLLSLKDDGSGRLSASDFYKRGEFLASTDERFRPVSLTPGWDGSFYVVDMYRGVSQDGPLQTDYLRDYILKRRLWDHIHFGRIYRVVHKGMGADKKPRMSQETSAQLVEHLSHPNGWWRDTAQQWLVQRGDRTVAPALIRLATAAPDARTRLQALWTLDGLGASDPATVRAAFDEKDPAIRAAAIRLSEGGLRAGDAGLLKRLLAMTNDPSATVRRQLAASLGELPADRRIEPLFAMIRAHGDDPVLVDAAISGLAGQAQAMLVRVLAERSMAGQGDVVAMLAGAVGRSREAPAVERLLTLAAGTDHHPTIRLALLTGLGTGLQGASGPMNIVAGGRAGGSIPGMAMRRGAASARLDLAREPKALLAMARGTGEFAAPAGQLLGVIGWPGKPVETALARTPEEQALFNSGREIYANICSGCHLAEGRGAKGVAADLAGSHFVLASPDVVVRILLSGKEGAIGLMPPAGATMTDEEVAAVVTYVRGSWGNKASAVLPAAVREWRSAYAHRKTPWTEPELEPRR